MTFQMSSDCIGDSSAIDDEMVRMNNDRSMPDGIVLYPLHYPQNTRIHELYRSDACR